MDPRLRRFAYEHLPQPLQEFSRRYYELAEEAISNHDDDPLLDGLLDKLWEAKNLAVLMVARPAK